MRPKFQSKHIHKYLLTNTHISLSLYLNVTSQQRDSPSDGGPNVNPGDISDAPSIPAQKFVTCHCLCVLESLKFGTWHPWRDAFGG